MYDKWEGYGGQGVFRFQEDEEDREAEEIYEFCEKKMDERRKSRREKQMKEELSKLEREKLTTYQ